MCISPVLVWQFKNLDYDILDKVIYIYIYI